jgi:hypothetical protein
MIDRATRNHLALLLRRLMTGQIDSDEFDNYRPDESADPGVVAVSLATWTNLYSDHWPVRYAGQRTKHHCGSQPTKVQPKTKRWLDIHLTASVRRLPLELRSEVLRWIVFLNSDTPYEWPVPPTFSERCLSFVARLFLTGTTPDPLSRWMARGDFGVWPFSRRLDYERALAQPRLLTGGPQHSA